jgi:hypothetical protein
MMGMKMIVFRDVALCVSRNWRTFQKPTSKKTVPLSQVIQVLAFRLCRISPHVHVCPSYVVVTASASLCCRNVFFRVQILLWNHHVIFYFLLLIMLIMSTGWDYVSELRQPKGLLFIPQVIYKYGEPWWKDIDRGNSSFVHHSSLAILAAVI